jgi:hypothetical protein
MRQGIRGPLFVRIQNNVGVALVKHSIHFLWPCFDLKIFDSPHSSLGGLPHTLPSSFQLRSGCFDFAIQVGPNCFRFWKYSNNTRAKLLVNENDSTHKE